MDEQFFRQKEVKAVRLHPNPLFESHFNTLSKQASSLTRVATPHQVIKGARGVDGSNAAAPVKGKKKHFNKNKHEKIRRVMNK